MRPPDVDIRLLEVTTRTGWEPRRIVVTYEEMQTDPSLWNAMFFRDWDRVPEPLRSQGLSRMSTRFRPVVGRPAAWKKMTPAEWDRVPQPLRAMAFMDMVARWEVCLGVARRFGRTRSEVVARLCAVAMAESWFQHRAVNENADGTSDLGLAQATDATRRILRRRARAGLADFSFDDEDYFDPLNASRVLVYWFALMLDETNGDLAMATRAYHVGSGRAHAGEGADYLAGVMDVEERFMRGVSESPSWRFLWAGGSPLREEDATQDPASRCSFLLD